MHPRSPNRSGPGVLAGVLGVLVVAASIQAATEPAAGDDEAELDPVGLLVPDAQLDPRILFLELTGSSWQGAVSRLEQALFDLQQATRGREAVSATVVELGGKLDRLRGDLERTLVDETELAEQLARLDRALAHHAVERFVRHGSGSDPTDVVAGLDAARTRLLA
ncbi:MAG: hypothetical protein ACE5GB_08010, partial [Acidimicrobiales bacterium]